jgi:hypothetical protein
LHIAKKYPTLKPKKAAKIVRKNKTQIRKKINFIRKQKSSLKKMKNLSKKISKKVAAVKKCRTKVTKVTNTNSPRFIIITTIKKIITKSLKITAANIASNMMALTKLAHQNMITAAKLKSTKKPKVKARLTKIIKVIKFATKSLRISVAVNKANTKTLLTAQIATFTARKSKNSKNLIKLLNIFKVVKIVENAVRTAKKMIERKTKIAKEILRLRFMMKRSGKGSKVGKGLRRRVRRVNRKMVEVRAERDKAVRAQGIVAVEAGMKMGIKVDVSGKMCKCEVGVGLGVRDMRPRKKPAMKPTKKPGMKVVRATGISMKPKVAMVKLKVAAKKY